MTIKKCCICASIKEHPDCVRPATDDEIGKYNSNFLGFMNIKNNKGHCLMCKQCAFYRNEFVTSVVWDQLVDYI